MEENSIMSFKLFKRIFINNIAQIIIITLITTIAAAFLTLFVIPKKYSSNSLLYVGNNKTISDSYNINDINAAQKIVLTCQILFTSESIFNQVINDLDLPYSISEMKSIVSVQSVNGTEVLKIEAITDNAVTSADIANKMSELSQEEFKRVIKSGSIEAINDAKVSNGPIFPKTSMFIASGFFLGLVLSYGAFFMRYILDRKIKSEEDLTKIYNIPVFAEIVDFNSKVKGGYSYE